MPILFAPLQYALGAILIAAGGASAVLGIRRFRAADTNVKPSLPATTVVSDGIYGFTRNPMYLGLSLVYAGIAVATDSIWTLALLVPLLTLMGWGVIGREERYLEGKFGEDYRVYKARVRRWL